jgi:hypothetical protein
MRQFNYLISILFAGLTFFDSSSAQGIKKASLNDGPYIFRVNDNFKVRWIENGQFKRSNAKPEDFPEIKKKFNLLFDYKDLSDTYLLKKQYNQVYKGVDSISIISDIHGEYGFYLDLLKGMGVIDNNLNWSFGKGHLVVLGDVFDRGDMVTETLWHLFGLEKQAEKAGGKIHILLGNHEFMVLSKEVRYTSDKYYEVEKLMLTDYTDLYSDESVLGRWLRLKPVMITINDILFVHGGVSIDMVRRNLNLENTNRIYSEKILGKDYKTINENEELKFLNNDKGPIWYRGYFEDTKFCETKMDSILTFYSMKHIVVGHTECDVINALFGSKVLGIDTGIQDEVPSEMLLIKEGKYYRGLVSGKRILLDTGEPAISR